MNKRDDVAMVPKYRFPEFRGNGVWEENFIDEIADYENGKAHENDILESGKYTVVNSKFISTEGQVRKHTNIPNLLAKKGDILMVLSDVPNGKALAKCYLVAEDNTYTVNQRICRITPRKVNSILLFYIINRNKYFLFFNDGVKQTNLKKNDVLSCSIFIPKEPKEQQKIANCLSSIDELISAEEKKLSLLNDYKKGWMQKLFPAEGETVPEWRFPEFKDSGEWKEKKLGEVCNYWNGDSHESNVNENGEYYLISLNSIDIDGNLKSEMKKITYTDYSLKKNDLIMVLSDIAHGNFLGLTAIIPNDRYVLNQRMGGLRIKDSRNSSPFFIRAYINYNQKYFKSNGQGSSQLNLSKSSVIDFSMLLPSLPEQQKITNFLSGIDDLINKQTGKIKMLKQHKKALMQGLFPSIGEVL